VHADLSNPFEYCSDRWQSVQQDIDITKCLVFIGYVSEVQRRRQFSTRNPVVDRFAFFRIWSFPSCRWRSVAVQPKWWQPFVSKLSRMTAGKRASFVKFRLDHNHNRHIFETKHRFHEVSGFTGVIGAIDCTDRAGPQPMQLHWAPRFWGSRAMVFAWTGFIYLLDTPCAREFSTNGL